MAAGTRLTLDDLTWPRRTARLMLRRGIPDDAAAIFAHRRLAEVGRWLTHIQNDPEAELMWAFHPDWGGQGYATEAVSALIEICFGELGLRPVEAHCFGDNPASWKLMERVGMRREAHFVASVLHRDGTWRDFLSYGLLASER